MKKKFSAPLVIMKMQLKTMKYHPPFTKMAIIKKTLTRVGEDVEKSEHSHIVGGELRWCSHFEWVNVNVLVTRLCPTLCKSMDFSLPGSSVHGILQARILEWVAMPSLGGIFPTQGWDQCLLHLLHWQVDSLPLVPLGKPMLGYNSGQLYMAPNLRSW